MTSLSKATLLITGNIPIHKQLKHAITEGNEDKAITIYMSKDGSKIPPSKPFPTKKPDSSEDTPMHISARFALAKLFKMFMEYGGNPNCLNKSKENCAHATCRMTSFPSKRAEILDLVYDWHGQINENTVDVVNVNAVDIEGNTALHLAAFHGLLPCVEKLVRRGANLSILNNENLSCSDFADKGNHFPVAMMLELSKIFEPEDEIKEATQLYRKFTSDIPISRAMPECNSMSLPGLIDFMNECIKITSEELNESAARSEVLLNIYNWDYKALKRDYDQDRNRVLALSKLKPRHMDVSEHASKNGEINVGIPVEDIYFDPCYGQVASFTVYQEGRKKVFSFQNYDGKVGVFPIDYDPSFKFLDSEKGISETSHMNPKRTDPCPMCGKIMHEPASIQHFLSGTLVEPLHREISCSSGHKFCFSCWSEYISYQLKKENSTGCLPCPQKGCGEILDLQWAPIMLKKSDLVNRLIAQRQKHLIDILTLRWCPVSDCGLLLHVPQVIRDDPLHNGLDVAQRLPKSSFCQHGHGFCLDCYHEAHAPITCNQLPIWMDTWKEETKLIDAKNDRHLLYDLVYFPLRRKCPKCQEDVYRGIAGCNMVICTHCHASLCFLCMDEWSNHGIKINTIHYCNRFNPKLAHNSSSSSPMKGGTAGGEASYEEKVDDIQQIRRKEKLEKQQKFIFYGFRYKAHEVSWTLESECRVNTLERVAEALKASHEGHLKWLHGNAVRNPYEDKELEEADQHLVLNRLESKTVEMDKFFVPKEEAIAFLFESFDELERCRSFLKWSYPFLLIEFDDRLDCLMAANAKVTIGTASSAATGMDSGKVSTNGYITRERLEEFKNDYQNLQGALEYMTEMLSNLIARNRIRGTRKEIEQTTRDAKARRVEFELFLMKYYLTRRPTGEKITVNTRSLHTTMTNLTEMIAMTTMTTTTTMVQEEEVEEEPAVKEEEHVETKSVEQRPAPLFHAGSTLIHHGLDIQREDLDTRIHIIPAVYRQESYVPPPPPPALPIIEQRLIGAKKDPDQEALEHAILISKQEEEFGINMYDSLTDEDEPTVEEYIAQGFTREEAILIIFEEKFGKVSIQTSRITPAMPTLHRIETEPAVTSAMLAVAPEDESEIEALMTKGYTREQAIEVMFAERLRREEARFNNNQYNNNNHNNYTQNNYNNNNSHNRSQLITRLASSNMTTTNYSSSNDNNYYYDEQLSQQISPISPALTSMTMTEEERQIQEYIALGYTREQAIARIVATSVTAAAAASNGINGGGGISRSNSQNIQMRERTIIDVELDNSHGMLNNNNNNNEIIIVEDEENMIITEEHAEVSHLMSLGYTREQAIAAVEVNQRNRRGNNTMTTMTAASSNHSINNNSTIQQVEDPDVQRLMNLGYSRETAIQMVLQRLTNNGNGGGGGSGSSVMSGRNNEQQQHSTMGNGSGSMDNIMNNNNNNNHNNNTYNNSNNNNTNARSIYRASSLINNNNNHNNNDDYLSNNNNNNNLNNNLNNNSNYGSNSSLGGSHNQNMLMMNNNNMNNNGRALPMIPPPSNGNGIYRGLPPQQPSMSSNSFMDYNNNNINNNNSMMGGMGPGPAGGPAASSSEVTMTFLDANTMGDISFPPPPNRSYTVNKSAEELEMDRVLLISQQEAEFGVNMYDSLTPADDPDIENMMAIGWSQDEAILMIFNRRYGASSRSRNNNNGNNNGSVMAPIGMPSIPPSLQLQQAQQQQQQVSPQFSPPGPPPPQQFSPPYGMLQQQRSMSNYNNNGSSMYGGSQAPASFYGNNGGPVMASSMYLIPSGMNASASNYNAFDNNNNQHPHHHHHHQHPSHYSNNSNNNTSHHNQHRPMSTSHSRQSMASSRDDYNDDHRSASTGRPTSTTPSSHTKKKVFKGSSFFGGNDNHSTANGSHNGHNNNHNNPNASRVKASDLHKLEKMGFGRDEAIRALLANGQNVNEAAEALASAKYR